MYSVQFCGAAHTLWLVCEPEIHQRKPAAQSSAWDKRRACKPQQAAQHSLKAFCSFLWPILNADAAPIWRVGHNCIKRCSTEARVMDVSLSHVHVPAHIAPTLGLH